MIADADGDGAYEVFFPTAFNNAKPGLFALDARTGRFLWKAPSILQSYRSTVVADLNGDGQNEILFGDKNSSLFCLDANGNQRWSTPLSGRGIFFAPAVADLDGSGAATLFVVVRGSGSNGKSLYALDAHGQTLDAVALPGGGASSPLLCRFTGQSALSLLVLSGGGQLMCYQPEQKPGGTPKILWPGIRNDLENSGYVKSTQSLKAQTPWQRGRRWTRQYRGSSAGLNNLALPMAGEADLLTVKTVAPDGSIRVAVVRLLPGIDTTNATIDAFAPGGYDVTLQWQHTGKRVPPRTEHYAYLLDSDYRSDAARLDQVLEELDQLGKTDSDAGGFGDSISGYGHFVVWHCAS